MKPIIPFGKCSHEAVAFIAIISVMLSALFGAILYNLLGETIVSFLEVMVKPPTGNIWAKWLVWHRAEWGDIGATVGVAGLWIVALDTATRSLGQLRQPKDEK